MAVAGGQTRINVNRLGRDAVLRFHIDDWVTAWHNSEPGSEQMSLYEYLGFTEVEGRMWSRDARALAPILENRRQNRQPA